MILQPPLRDAIGQREATIRHDLTGEGQLAPTNLIELGTRLPPSWVLAYDESGRRVGAAQHPELERLTTGGRSFRICHVELVPSFRAVIQRCYDGAATRDAARPEGGVTAESSIVFVGSPGAITPIHLDHHHNLLLQVRGNKRLTIARFDEPRRQQREVERAFGAMGACVGTPTSINSYLLEPGDGVYLPAYTFHSAEVLDGEVSVALSCAFSTPATERAYRMHRGHRALRRLRLHPRPTGVSPAADTITEWLGRGLERIRHSTI